MHECFYKNDEMYFRILKNVIFLAYFYTLYTLLSPKAAALACRNGKGQPLHCVPCGCPFRVDGFVRISYFSLRPKIRSR